QKRAVLTWKEGPVRKLLMLFLALSLALAGCGFGSDDEEDDTVSIEDAETCEEAADAFAAVAQNFINDAEEAGMQALMAGPDSELFQEYTPQLEEAQAKAEELGCDEEEMRALLAERVDDLETDGPVGETIVEFLREESMSQ
ncbi:MAG TPA: hypothetical protein VHG52_11840, partial [Thermomicrobiales bacterium]|nr:hypothetical protein [Thermomicrobiales bacterium]